MSKFPAGISPLIIAFFIICVGKPVFCAQELPAEIKEQAQIYRQEGYKLQKDGDLQWAFSCYQKATLVDPDYAVAYNDMGVILESAGELNAAKEMYLKATVANTDYPNSYSNLALLYEKQKDYANAVLCWIRRAILGEESDPWAKAARKRLEDIARIYPQAFSKIGENR